MNTELELEEDAVDVPPAPAAEPRPGGLRRWKDRAWTWRSVIAVGLAMLVLGGLGGIGVGMAIGHDGHHHSRGGFQHRGGNFQPGPNVPQGGFQHSGPGQFPPGG